MLTTLYLIRHSERFNTDIIDKYNVPDSDLLKAEKNILSIEGERRAKILSEISELKDIDRIYVSNCVRTLETAKYLLDKQNLKVSIDSRFDERRVGISNDKEHPDWFKLQYLDENYKTVGGESQKEVRERFNEAFLEVLDENRGKRVAIFAHGLAITFFLMQWMKLVDIKDDKKLTFEFDGRIIFNKRINAPEVFKILVDDNNNVIDIINIEVNYD